MLAREDFNWSHLETNTGSVLLRDATTPLLASFCVMLEPAKDQRKPCFDVFSVSCRSGTVANGLDAGTTPPG